MNKMKLSTAIREGSKLRPQGTKKYFSGIEPDVKSCALGAAYEAVHNKVERDPSVIFIALDIDFKDATNFLSDECHVCGHKGIDTIFVYATHLNDHHNWTREEVADWIESKGF